MLLFGKLPDSSARGSTGSRMKNLGQKAWEVRFISVIPSQTGVLGVKQIISKCLSNKIEAMSVQVGHGGSLRCPQQSQG